MSIKGNEDSIRLDNSGGEQYNGMPTLLSIASKYFERGRQSVVDALR
jgi:hypothetical protein